MVKGLQKQYNDLPLPEGARLADMLQHLNIDRELFAFSDGKRLEANTILDDGMEINIISPSTGG